MHKSRAQSKFFVHLLIIVTLLAQQLVIPFAAQAAITPTANLLRGASEDLDAYLQRVAAAQPELFQQAALAAVQDAFNGTLPQVAGEQAMEEQIAHYVQLAASGVPFAATAPPPPTSASAVQGDTYQWNSAQTDASGLAGSEWQLTARPGVDPQLFGEQFEKLLATEPLPIGLPPAADPPVTTATPPLEQGMLPNLPAAGELGAIEPLPLKLHRPTAAPSTAPAAEQTMTRILHQASQVASRQAAKVRQWQLPQMADLRAALAREPNLHRTALALAAPALAVPAQQAVQADLAVQVRAPATATFGAVITYTVTMTNYGPSVASAVQLTQTLPANGVYTGTVAGCSANNTQVVCAVGALGVNAPKSLQLLVQMKGNNVVTSTVQIADKGGTLDPGGRSATASASTTVTASTRSERKVGNVLIAANEFITVAGQIEASGAVEIGYKKENITSTFHLRLGPNDSVSWQAGAEQISGGGTLFQILKSFELFKGGFSIDGSKKDPLLLPSPTITPTVKKLAGFELVGKAVITQVTIITGTASVSASIKLGQPGVVTNTVVVTTSNGVTNTQVNSVNKEPLVGLIHPGGAAEGTIPKFSMIFAGLKIEVDKATLSDESIKVKQAKLTMPDKFGKLTGILSEMVIKADSINFGGVGVKIPVPDIYPVGKPMTNTVVISPTSGLTQTTTVTPTVAIVKNSATVNLTKGKLVLQLEGTLQLWLPGNERKIPIEFKIDSDGQLEGKVKEITLTIAGQELSMKEVEISNAGLKVAEASLTIKGPEEKDKAAKDKLAAAKPITGSAVLTDTTKPDKPTENKRLTVIVKNVVINGSGLSIGGAGITNYLPDIKIGESATFTKMEFTVVVNDPTGKASLELAIKGTLKIHIESNKQDIEFSAKMDKEGKFSGEIKEISLTIAKATLKLSKLEFNASRFAANAATLTLPEALGKTTVTVNKVVIDEKGISFGDAAVKIPVEFTIGKADGANSLAVKGELSLILAPDRTYGFAVEGTVTIKIAAQTAEATGSFRIDSKGATRGSIESFKLTIAGMELAIKNATVEGGVLKADEATLSIPKEWGGLSVSVYQIKISSDNFSIGGGSFKLPEIKVGDMVLTLEGTLKKEGNGYIIAAGGKLKMPNLGGAACSGLGVAVEIFASNTQQMVMRIQPLTATSAEALSLQLRKISVSLECTIPIGASGFELTSISGTLTLSANVTKIEIKVVMESQLRVGPFKAVTANGDMGLEYVRNPYKFEIGLGASMKIFSLFEAARAKASMRFTDGAVPFLFKAEMNIDAVIAKGEIKLAAWTKDGSFYLTGRIYGQVGVRKGAVGEYCWTIRYPIGWRVWREDNWRSVRSCLSIPPGDLFINATMEFGKFQRGGGDAWGFKAGVNILGKNYGIYVDSGGGFNVGNVDQYKLVDTPTLERARWLHAQVAAATLDQTTLTAEDRALLADYHFDGEQITIDVVNLTRPGDLGVTILRSAMDADVQITLVRPDGLGITGSNPPDNVTFQEGFLSFDGLTDSATGQPVAVGEVLPALRTFMNVTNAAQGQWRIVLNRQPTADFIINVDGTVYGPPVEKLVIANHFDADNQVNLSWTQNAVVTSTVSIYATQDTITSTASYTETQPVIDANGIMASQVVTVDVGTVTQFGGYPVAQFSYLAGSRTPTEQVDLAFLRSGSYHLWLEVDDGENPPTRRYFPGTVTVWHPWQTSWQANVSATPTVSGLLVAWDEHPNPDSDGYEIEVTTAGDLTDADSFRLDVGQRISETITGLTANRAYSITINAYDTGSGRLASSEEISAQPSPAPFTFSTATPAVTTPGGQPANVSLQVASAVNPYPDWVYLDVTTLPDGFAVALASDIVTPTVAGVQVGVVLTPAATLPAGVYTITLAAASNGDAKEIAIPVTVQEPGFTLQANQPAFTLYDGGTVSIAISAGYQLGESDEITLAVAELPAGVEWAWQNSTLTPGATATLVLTATDYLPLGSYPVTVVGSDGERDNALTFDLTVAGFDLVSAWDSWAIPPAGQATFAVDVLGDDWPDPVTLAFDPAALANYFAVQLSSSSVSVPASIEAQVTVLPTTPPGVYELLLQASSRGVTKLLPLYVTVQDDPTATDLQLTYLPATADATVIAGEVYSYTLLARNISANPAQAVTLFDTISTTLPITLVNAGGCTVQHTGDATELTCALGDIAPATENASVTLAWQVAADAPEGALLAHKGEVVAQAMPYTETATLDNLAGLAVEVVRLADLAVQTQASAASAGGTQTLTATVNNRGPSVADDTQVEIYLPAGTTLLRTSVGCTAEGDRLVCPVGNLPPTQSANVTATLAIAAEQRADLTTLVVAGSAADDPDYADNADLLVTEVSATAQLRLSVRPDRTAAVEGATVNYQLALINDGPAQATDIGVELALPAYADIVELQVGAIEETPEQLNLAPGETLTLSVAALFLEDSAGQPVVFAVRADATEAPPVQASDQSLRVSNANPTAVLSSTLLVNEGERGILTVQVNDAGGDYDPLTIAWDLDNDGQFDDGASGIVLFDARSLDGPTTQPIAVRVRDDDGGQVEMQGAVTVQGVAPMVDAGPDLYRAYDQSFTLHYEYVDPAATDKHTVQVDWGDGQIENFPKLTRSTLAEVSHVYNQIGEFTANLCVQDDDGARGCDQVVAQAACREHGLVANFASVDKRTVVSLHNTSGTVTIPARLALSLYNNNTLLQTFTLTEALAVGATQSLAYTWPDALPAVYRLRLVVDDPGTGVKATTLCSGTVERANGFYFVHLAAIGLRHVPGTVSSAGTQLYLPLIERR